MQNETKKNIFCCFSLFTIGNRNTATTESKNFIVPFFHLKILSTKKNARKFLSHKLQKAYLFFFFFFILYFICLLEFFLCFCFLFINIVGGEIKAENLLLRRRWSLLDAIEYIVGSLYKLYGRNKTKRNQIVHLRWIIVK